MAVSAEMSGSSTMAAEPSSATGTVTRKLDRKKPAVELLASASFRDAPSRWYMFWSARISRNSGRK
jgi:hypothetical protein